MKIVSIILSLFFALYLTFSLHEGAKGFGGAPRPGCAPNDPQPCPK